MIFRLLELFSSNVGNYLPPLYPRAHRYIDFVPCPFLFHLWAPRCRWDISYYFEDVIGVSDVHGKSITVLVKIWSANGVCPADSSSRAQAAAKISLCLA